jgi:hypothetical protein
MNDAPFEKVVEEILNENLPKGLEVGRPSAGPLHPIPNSPTWEIHYTVPGLLYIDHYMCAEIRCYDEPPSVKSPLPYSFGVVKRGLIKEMDRKTYTTIVIARIAWEDDVVTVMRPSPKGCRITDHHLVDPQSLSHMRRQLLRLKDLMKRIDRAIDRAKGKSNSAVITDGGIIGQRRRRIRF